MFLCRALTAISCHVEDLMLPGSLLELELISELKRVVGIPPGVEIPRNLRKFEVWPGRERE